MDEYIFVGNYYRSSRFSIDCPRVLHVDKFLLPSDIGSSLYSMPEELLELPFLEQACLNNCFRAHLA